MKTIPKRAFTIVELLVVISIIALLLGVLLPAVGKARGAARTTISQANLRQLSQAHVTYATEWNGRQFTLTNDNIAAYGTHPTAAAIAYRTANGEYPPGIILGWGTGTEGTYGLYGYWMEYPGNHYLMQPIDFVHGSGFGWFRIPNAKQFNQYVSGRYYDEVYYAPKDTRVVVALDECFVSASEFSDCTPAKEVYDASRDPCFNASAPPTVSTTAWSSYCLSPAALVNPVVLSRDGYQDPWKTHTGFKVPGMSGAKYSDLKTHLMEHHWLQNMQTTDCNAGFEGGSFDGCEPYYFNHSIQSAPIAAFYDGHVGSIGTREAIHADRQAGGLWSRDTAAYGSSGYFLDVSYDTMTAPGSGTSFHILTTDGIQGRDTLSR